MTKFTQAGDVESSDEAGYDRGPATNCDPSQELGWPVFLFLPGTGAWLPIPNLESCLSLLNFLTIFTALASSGF